MPASLQDAAWFLAGGGAALALGGAALLAYARHRDAANWILQRAPLLPLKLLNARDDAWVRGETRCESPLHVPHFGIPCLAYSYRQEEWIEESYEDSQGRRRTRTRWVTRQTRVEAVDFEIVEGNGSIRIHADEAELRDLEPLGPAKSHGGQLRHSASYLPHPSTVSALGCVSEHADWLEKHANIPLLVSPKTRAEVIASSERAEGAARVTGHVLLLLGIVAVLHGLGVRASVPVAAESLWSVPHAILAGITGATLFASAWTLHAFNTMLTYRLRTKAAWHQIDVDLKNRFDLVPRLVEVVRGALKHERAVLSKLADLRGTARGASPIERDRESAATAHTLVALEEDYPELTTAPLFARLHRELVAIEEKIAHDRAFYDDCATEFNSYTAQLPHAWLASLCGFREAPLFQAAPDEIRPPRFRVVGPKGAGDPVGRPGSP